MKRYISASTDPYSEVDTILQSLFGIPYAKYKRKSDWIDTEYGTLRYDISQAMNDPGALTIKILFDTDGFDPLNFYALLDACKSNNFYVSSSYPRGNDGYARSNPQINIRAWKVYAYDNPYEINKIVGEATHQYVDHASVTCETEGLQYLKYGINLYPNCGYNRSVEWVDTHQHEIDLLKQNICSDVQSRCTSLGYTVACKILKEGKGRFELKVTFK